MKRKKSSYLIIALVVFALVLTGAYALLAATLNITGTATGTGDFKIAFTDATVSNSDKANYNINTDGTVLTISSTLAYPGDSVTINFTIKNTGNLAARVNNLTITNNSNTDFKIDIIGLDSLEGTILDVGNTTTGSVVVTWNATATTSTPDDVSFNVVLDYVQATT